MSNTLIIGTLALIVSGFVTACSGTARVGTETVDSRYTSGGGEWSRGGGITVVARVFEKGGATVVCGAWTSDRQSALTTDLNDDVIAAASVFVGTTRLVQNLGFMARTAYSDNISGFQANCVASTTPWREEFAATAPRIRFPRMEFLIDDESDTSVRFRETARPAIIR